MEAAVQDISAARDVSFEATAEELELIRKIVNRFAAIYAGTGSHVRLSRSQQVTLEMCLVAANANGCPMDFVRLLAADDFNLVHDVAGIDRHISPSTGELQDCFWPRYAKRA